MFREEFEKYGEWAPFNVFNDPENDLIIDFYKRGIGVDVAFNHKSFIGGDMLRFQAASEVKNNLKVGVYICATKAFVKDLTKDKLVTFERTKWYLENFRPVLTVPILLIGLKRSYL